MKKILQKIRKARKAGCSLELLKLRSADGKGYDRLCYDHESDTILMGFEARPDAIRCPKQHLICAYRRKAYPSDTEWLAKALASWRNPVWLKEFFPKLDISVRF